MHRLEWIQNTENKLQASKNYIMSLYPKSEWLLFCKAELRHAVYACGKRMRFQSHLGQTKVVFDNQGKNAQQCGTF